MSSYGLGVVGAADHVAAADIVAGENGHDQFMARLPGERIGALTAALLDGLHLDIGPRTMRMLPDTSDARPAAVLRRLRDTWQRIFDASEMMWPAGRPVRIQVAGPWSLAAGIELFDGHLVLTDRGARRDIADALAEATVGHIARIQRRFAGDVHVQFDEPLLPAVMAGNLRGVHEWDTIEPVPTVGAVELLGRTIGAVRGSAASISINLPGTKLAGTAPTNPVPWSLLRALQGTDAQVETVLLPKRVIVGSENLDGLGMLISEGARVGLGIAQQETDPRAVAISVARLWDALSLRRDSLVSDVDVVPDGDLVHEAAAKLTMLRQAGEMLVRDAGDL